MSAKTQFRFWYYWILGANTFTLVVGLLVAFFGDSVLFELYNRGSREVFFDGSPLPENALAMKKWLFGVIGGATVGFHTLAIFIIRFAFLKKERWAWFALWSGLISWFLIDSTLSVWHGAYYNIYLINLVAFFLIATPLMATGKVFLKT